MDQEISLNEAYGRMSAKVKWGYRKAGDRWYIYLEPYTLAVIAIVWYEGLAKQFVESHNTSLRKKVAVIAFDLETFQRLVREETGSSPNHLNKHEIQDTIYIWVNEPIVKTNFDSVVHDSNEQHPSFNDVLECVL